MIGSLTSVTGVKVAPRPAAWARLATAVPDYWRLTKPEVNFLIVIATFTGFYLGLRNPHPFPIARLLNTLWGTLLVASGTGTLNQYLEYPFDAEMRRTCQRPIAARRVCPAAAAWFGLSLSIIGSAYLLIAVNALASALAFGTMTSYLLFYTPLKRITPLCTLAGAVPGAMPLLIGWAAASGSIAEEGAWILYGVLFFWQFPHFMAIAWIYREDYARAGYWVLPRKNENAFLAWFTCVPSVGLFIATLSAVSANGGGVFGYGATAMLGCGLLYYATRQTVLRSRPAARRLLKATIVYLPLQFLVLVLGKA